MPSSAAALPATGAFWAGDATSARGRRLSELLAPPPPPLGSSASSGSGSSSGASSLLRHYIDPWDLENYAYLRRQDAAAAGCCSSTPALESSQSDFSYIPGSLEYPYPPPAVDEEPFYNAARTLRKTSSVMRRHSAAAAPNMHAVYGSNGHGHHHNGHGHGHDHGHGHGHGHGHDHGHDHGHGHGHGHGHEHGHGGHVGGGVWKGAPMEEELGDGSAGGDSCRLYSPSLLVRRPPGDLVYVYGGRKLALPDVMGHGDTCCYSLSGGGSSSEDDEERCCYFDSRTMALPPPPESPEPLPPPPPAPATRYALSRHGHLRLDYSWSWASLDRYIAAAD